MTFRVGQKVVCVDANPISHEYVMKGARPYVGGIYTVVGFRDCQDGSPGLILDIDRGWQYYTWRFRPIVERKTDISIFTAMLTKTGVDA